jgi:ribonucleotide reductase alpha subunit
MSSPKTPWGPIGYITYKRTYSRRLKENDTNSATEEFNQTVERVIRACRTQLKVGFTESEEKRIEEIFLSLKGSVAGRFWWQLGTKTVDRLGLLSLQNCAGTVVDSIRAFTWTMDALMLGSGVGYNIQREYVYQLPKVKRAKIVRYDANDADFIVPDSREGWVKLLELTLKAHFEIGKGFSYSTICVRGKGAPIKGFGGLASGPEELCWGIEQISNILNARVGKKIRPIDALDIMNIIGFVVVAGNVRRSAQLAVGDMDDLQFLNAKNWNLGNIPNWRAMSNNSVACNDIKLLPEQFWEGYNGNGEAYGLINIKLSQDIGRLGETEYPDKNVIVFNPCVTGDTEILTSDGHKRIDSLVDQEIEIWNGFEWSKVTPKITGKNQEILTISFSDGRVLNCTKYHRFHVAVDYKGKTEEVEAKDLEPGMKLIKHNFPVIEHGEEVEDKYAYTQGFISAEGSDGYKLIWVYAPKLMCLPRLLGTPGHKNEERTYVGLKHQFNPKSFVPFNWNLKGKLGWLSGLFDGDGCELREGGLQLVSVDFVFLRDLQKLLSTLGVQSKVVPAHAAVIRNMPDGHGGLKEYNCQESKRILIGAAQMQFLKKMGLKCERLSFNKTPQRDASQFVSVVDITESEQAETVYCFNEPKRNLGIFNGILTGQCAEQSLASYETCCLAEIFLPNIASKDELFEVATYLYRINKHSLALPCHAEETEEIVHKHMRMGIGVTGYLQATEEQRGWLSDTYNKLRKFDKEYSDKHGWPASIKLTTTKPSGTLSLLPNVTPGVHPAYSRYYIRRIRIASNNPLIETCRQNGYDIEYQRNFDGADDKNTLIVSFPVSVPEGTIVAKDLTAIEQMEYVKRLQTEWSDNAVSCTVYYKIEELPEIKKWLKKNYNKSVKTMSFLLHQDHGFAQAPYEEITKEQYEEYHARVKPITSGNVVDDGIESMECASGICPIK